MRKCELPKDSPLQNWYLSYNFILPRSHRSSTTGCNVCRNRIARRTHEYEHKHSACNRDDTRKDKELLRVIIVINRSSLKEQRCSYDGRDKQYRAAHRLSPTVLVILSLLLRIDRLLRLPILRLRIRILIAHIRVQLIFRSRLRISCLSILLGSFVLIVLSFQLVVGIAVLRNAEVLILAEAQNHIEDGGPAGPGQW